MYHSIINILVYNKEYDAVQPGFSLYKAVFIIVLITALGFLAMITRLLQIQIAKAFCKKKDEKHCKRGKTSVDSV